MILFSAKHNDNKKPQWYNQKSEIHSLQWITSATYVWNAFKIHFVHLQNVHFHKVTKLSCKKKNQTI